MKHDKIKNLIKEIIEKTGQTVSNISVIDNDTPPAWFNVEVNEPHFFTGRDGEGLMALNHIVRRVLESKGDGTEENPENEILIDINNFQKKRIESIQTMAHMFAERARYFKSSIEVNPMSSFERRIVHEFLSNETDLKTESTGTGSSRRVVIRYVGPI